MSLISFFREKLRDRKLVLVLALLLLLLLLLLLIPKKVAKDTTLPGLATNKVYLDNLILPTLRLPEWFYPYESQIDFRYSDKELERLLPEASPDLVAELEQKRKAKINEILKH